MTTADVLTPHRMTTLPKDRVGRPIPFFVQWFAPDGRPTEPGVGQPDHRVVDERKLRRAVREGLCWVCGKPLARTGFVAFVIGPMCAINRVSSEPPSHQECAVYSATHCPFLTKPHMRRRDQLREDVVQPAGIHSTRNPGVSLVWVTKPPVQAFAPSAGEAGLLFEIGEPVGARWFSEGRAATREEVFASIDSGYPLLDAICDEEDDPAVARAKLQRRRAVALKLVERTVRE